MAERYTEQELEYIREHYATDGPMKIAERLRRTRNSVQFRAKLMGLRCRVTKAEIEAGRSKKEEQRVKFDPTQNGDSEELKKIIEHRHVLDNGKVQLRLDARTVVLVDAKKATVQHVAHLKKILNKPMRSL